MSPMNPAQYRTHHDALGVSGPFLAEKTGVTVGRIWAYEHPMRALDIPETAAKVILELAQTQENLVSELAGQMIDNGHQFERLRTPQDVDATYPEIAGWGLLAYGLIIKAAADRALEQSGIETKVTYAEKVSE